MTALHRVDTLDSLLSRLQAGTASLADLEDAMALTERYGFTAKSPKLYRLRDLVEDRLDADPVLAAEVAEIARRKALN